MRTTDLSFDNRRAHRAWLETQSKLPSGFRAASMPLEFHAIEADKPARMCLNLIALTEPSEAFAAVFTQNAFPGAPVKIGRERLKQSDIAAIVINNKVSNVCAPDGELHAQRICAEVGQALGFKPEQILPASTGIIGWRLPVEEICATVVPLVAALQENTILPVAEGIMTTDLYPKVRAQTVGSGRIVGIAKGAGMIEPNLATMLVYLLTDLDLSRDLLRQLLPQAVARSFNAISIDSDQSTSDTVALISSRRVPCTDVDGFAEALSTLCSDLAADVVRNGEGVHHVVRCTVRGARDEATAKGVAKSVLNSPLMQCAICGNDANVGRLVMAIGKYCGNERIPIDPNCVQISIEGLEVFSRGTFLLDPRLDAELHHRLRQAELYASAPPDENGMFRPPIDYPPHERAVAIDINLGAGDRSFSALGSDRSHEYISENADYRS